MKIDQFDAIVIGAGQGGGPLACALAKSGRTTALIEREYAGGTCVNWGCTPTKTMIASGRVAYLAKRAADYGVNISDVSIDMSVVRDRKHAIVESFRAGSQNGIDSTDGLEFLQGEATFTGDYTIEVTLNEGGIRQIRAETIVINTGERARELDIEVEPGVTILDNRTVMELGEVPEHLVVIGGGPIALEFAQLFRRLGANVTILNRSDRILSREDEDISRAVAEILSEDGIRIQTNTSPTSIRRSTDGLAIEIESSYGSIETIPASHVLNAAGRVPNVEVLHLSKAGVETDRNGYILTNEKLETNIAGIFAIGDVTTGPKFTHISYDDFRILRANLIEGGSRSVQDRLVAATTYIDPQLGRVGPTEKELRDQGVPYLIASMPMKRVARALETDESRGLMKVLVHAETEKILSAAILGIEGGELASMLQIAMMGDLSYTSLRDGVFAHPTLAESLNNLFADLKEPKA